MKNGVQEVLVVDTKANSTRKIPKSSLTNLSPLLFSHRSAMALASNKIYLFDKKYVQCIDVVSNFESFLDD